MLLSEPYLWEGISSNSRRRSSNSSNHRSRRRRIVVVVVVVVVIVIPSFAIITTNPRSAVELNPLLLILKSPFSPSFILPIAGQV